MFDSRQIPGEIVDVLVVRQSYLDRHPQRVRQLIESWYRALDFMQQSPVQASRLLSVRLGVEPDDVPALYEGLRLPSQTENYALLVGGAEGPGLLGSARRLGSVMRAHDLLSHEIDEALLFPSVGAWMPVEVPATAGVGGARVP